MIQGIEEMDKVEINLVPQIDVANPRLTLHFCKWINDRLNRLVSKEHSSRKKILVGFVSKYFDKSKNFTEFEFSTTFCSKDITIYIFP